MSQIAATSKRLDLAIIHYSGPPIIGGVESTIYHHARFLAEAGFGVHIIAGRGEIFHPGVAFHQIPEMDSRHPEVLETGKTLARGEVTAQFKNLRNKLIEDLRPLLSHHDVCVMHNVTTLHKNLALTAALDHLSAEQPSLFVSWAHDFAWLDPIYTPDLHPGYPWDLLRRPWPGMHYVAVSAHRKKLMCDLFGISPEDIRVIHPGVDLFQFLKLENLTEKLIEKLDLLESDPLILCPTRIIRRKNIEFAIKVTASLAGRYPRASLVVTGPIGPHDPSTVLYLDELKGISRESGVADRVHFLYEQGDKGHLLNVPSEVVSDFFTLADLLLFPSLREGFGIPVLEAGLTRIPVFAADIPPVRESAANLAHLFDPEGDPATVAGIIADHLADSTSYQLRRRVIREFTWQAVLSKKVIPFLEEIANHG